MTGLIHEELVSGISTLFATARVLSWLQVPGDTHLNDHAAYSLDLEFNAARARLDGMARGTTDAELGGRLRRVVDGCDEVRNRPPTSTLAIAVIADILDAANEVVKAVPPLPR